MAKHIAATMDKNKIVNTILFCFNCKRNLVMRGKSEWVDTGTMYSGSRNLNHVTVVVCYECKNKTGFKIDNTHMSVTEAEIGGVIHDLVTMMNSTFGPPAVVHSIGNLDADASVEQTWRGKHKTIDPMIADMSKVMIPVVNVDLVMSSMMGSYGVMSVANSKIVAAQANFISGGHPVGQPDDILYTPFNVHTVLYCSKCWRNIIFSGWFSALKLGPHVLEGKEMAMIVFVQCSSCEGTNKMSDEEIYELACHSLIVTMGPLENVKRYFGQNVNVNRYAPGGLGGITVVPRVVFVNRMRYCTEMWSLVENAKTNLISNFV